MKKNSFLLFFVCLFIIACGRYGRSLDNKPFDQGKVPTAPDYSKAESWAALPFKKDMADSVPSNGGLKDRQANAPVDVFFIHPTSYLKTNRGCRQWNADVNNAEINKKTDEGAILYQASIFNGIGKIYAPRYRQTILHAYFSRNKDAAEKAFALAYSDVKRAFEYYMQHYNAGRPLIIAAHSQGSTHAKKLLQEFFDGKPLEKKLVAAYLVGMDIYDTLYASLKPCWDADDCGCYISWRTFAPGYMTQGIKNTSGAICVNPLSWKTDGQRVDHSANKGAVLKDFSKIEPGISDAMIQDGVLRADPHFKGSQLLKNYHILDYNLFYLSIRENAENRAKQYFKKKGT